MLIFLTAPTLLSLFAAPQPSVTAGPLAPPAPAALVSAREQETAKPALEPPAELFDVVRVVDGDTIHIQRGDRTEKLRLLSVDTEEKLTGRGGSATKPETVFGEECALWAQEFFAALVPEERAGEAPRVGLRFPNGKEARDVYGRLLCHVILPDGRDFNLLLVELGKSPYFNKYGNSLIAHDEFVAAQRRARAARRGIWDPATNRPADDEAPSARRPYERLLPWWQVRADAVDAFRARQHAEPTKVVSAEEPAALEAAAARGGEVDVFGQIFRIFDEDDGSRTVLFRSSDKERSLRVRIAKGALAAHAELDLDGSLDEFRQNYLWVHGELRRGERGFELRTAGPSAWRRAGPEPVMPVEAAAGAR